MTRCLLPLVSCLLLPAGSAFADKPLTQEPNTWVKRSPLKGAPVSPGMGYESSLGYDPIHHRLIRFGGHNQGGGGEQNAETWILDPVTMKWELKEPNRCPPGVCCAQQNVFDVAGGRFLRFPAFSGNHGWHWFRENYLNNTSVWSYDLGTNTWRDLRPGPTPHPAPLRCASWDSHHQVVVLAGGEGNKDGTFIYDPYTNTWHRSRSAPQPAPRSGGNLAYDAERKLHILFGSQFTDDPHTWAYDLARDQWRDLKPDVQPPTKQNDAVLAYDPAQRMVVAVVRVADKQINKEILAGHLETWGFDADKNAWKRLQPRRELDGWGNRRRVLVAVPDQQLLLMEVFVTPSERVPGVTREQQIWTYRSGPTIPARSPPPPAGLAVETQPVGKALLKWAPAVGAKEYRVYRGQGTLPWQANMKVVANVPVAMTTWKDGGLAAGKVYHYQARAVGDNGRLSDPSIRVRTQPHIVEDAVVSVLSPKEAQVTWPASQEADVVGYHLERAVVEVFSEDEILRLKKDTAPLAEPSVGAIRAIGTFTRLTKDPIRTLEYKDTGLDLTRPTPVEGKPIFTHRFRRDQLDPRGKPYRLAVYAYRIRAVNQLGIESGPSPYFLTIPSAPQWLLSREDGTKCHLKWAASPEKSLKGYRVYRMESPRINGPGQKVTRLTADPLTEPRYTDLGAGKDTRRFWIVAVDALDQEGLPSAPAWHYREYRRYYEPFVGKWHQ
jgi:hypothetical protein